MARITDTIHSKQVLSKRHSWLGLLNLAAPDTGRAHALPEDGPVLSYAYLLKVRQESSLVDSGRMQTYAPLALCKATPHNIPTGKSVFAADFTYS